jgi:predicted AAA+ superfamily ATPase
VHARKRLIQVLIGPRQTGKTTAATQTSAAWKGPVVDASADAPLAPGPEWVETHWERARRAARDQRRIALLVLDEVQKVRGWSQAVKALWDADRRSRARVQPLLLGSSALLVQRGLTESLAGRFFLHRCRHWGYSDCRAAFGFTLDQWLFFGGYPGAAAFRRDESRWRRYITDALIETAIARDVLAFEKVTKPALLRQLFGLATRHPAEILSFNKMLGSLQDAGNTVTLAHYLKLLDGAFLVSGLERVSGGPRERGSSPKLIAWNNALVSSLSGLSFREAKDEPEFWGRLVENAVGAHLLNELDASRFHVGYFRDRNDEVDFVATAGGRRVGIEVKSGRSGRLTGLRRFVERFEGARGIVVGAGGLPLDEALVGDPRLWLGLR